MFYRALRGLHVHQVFGVCCDWSDFATFGFGFIESLESTSASLHATVLRKVVRIKRKRERDNSES